MPEIVVFDSGWGGELFANVLKKEVPEVKVTKVIDWRRAPYSKSGRTEVCLMTEKALLPYIGRVDIIVLASYVATGAALFYLEWKYPHQRFIGFPAGMGEVVRKMRKNVYRLMLLAPGTVRESTSFRRDRKFLVNMGMDIFEPECTDWITMVDDGEMTENTYRIELGEMIEYRPDAILIYSTGLVDMKPIFESVYGKNVIMIDEFEKVTEQVKEVLEDQE